MPAFLHMRNQRIAEARRRNQLRPLHQTFKVIRHSLGTNGAVGALDDQIRRFRPAHVSQHHFSRENQRTRVDLILAGVLRCSTVGGFEHRHGVGQVGARCDADTAHFRRQGVGR